MNRGHSLGRIAGLNISFAPSALLGSLGIAVLVYALLRLKGRSSAASAAVALLAVPAHWLSSFAHHVGHAFAARQTGYPMCGIHFRGVLGVSLYPRDEPPLPAKIHIRRALGGPPASILIALAALALRLVLPLPGPVRDLALLVALDNLIEGPGAFFPLPFTDGGTLRTWLPRRGLPAGEASS
jgi:hypothetical protein